MQTNKWNELNCWIAFNSLAGATSEKEQKVNNEGEIEQRERVEDRESNEQEEDRETKEDGREAAGYGKERDMENECWQSCVIILASSACPDH